MSRKSSLTVTYPDLVKWLKKQAAYAKSRHSGAPGRGVTNVQALRHDLECAETLVRMVERCEPGHQADLFEKYQQVK